MINKLYTVISKTSHPYTNVSMEEWLMMNVPEEAVTFYLWQNERTVVVGRNQNVWAECRVKELEEDGGHFFRRLSGGGSVYHDTQNLNFTFLANDEDYDLDRQSEVILLAMRKLGLNAERSGRNDITIDGKKFSGNAFYQHKGKRYHHGTILVDVDTDAMNKYLMPAKAKLESKGVSSVKSRVVNIKTLVPDLTIDRLKEVLIEAFDEVYGLKSEPLADDAIDHDAIAERETFFSSWEWKYGKNVPFSFETPSIRFTWGSAQVRLNVEKGIIVASEIFSDANDGLFIEGLNEHLIGQTFDAASIRQALDLPEATAEQKVLLSDIVDLILGDTETQ